MKEETKIEACPACGLASMYSREMDRYVHMSGVRNDACWEHISSGNHDWYAPSGFDLENPRGRSIKVTRGSEVTMRAIRWWEPGIVLAASINLLAGREGKGKSTVAASWAARETHNGGTVLWIGTEESREHAVTPRLKAAGADLTKVLFFDVETAGITTTLQLPMDLLALEAAVVENKVSMIVMDPCKGLVPTDFRGNDDVAVRQYLEPIAALCSRRDVVMIGLMHFGKREDNDSGKLILGSVAWSQVARSVISIAEDEESDTRVITNTKTNYSPTARSLEFSIVTVDVETEDGISTLGAVQWIGETTKDARNFLGSQDYEDDDEERSAAEDWLEDYLGVNGSVPSKDVKAAAAKEKIAERTLKRAKKNLGVQHCSDGFPRTTYWFLPESDGSPRRGPTGPTGPTVPDQQESDGPTGAGSTVRPVGPTPRPCSPTVPKGVPIGGVTDKTPGNTERVAAALARAQQTVSGPPCLICGEPVTAGQGDTHFSCKDN